MNLHEIKILVLSIISIWENASFVVKVVMRPKILIDCFGRYNSVIDAVILLAKRK